MENEFASGMVWFRRDLRIDDNAALWLALRSCQRVYCAFVFDRDILDPLPRADRRVELQPVLPFCKRKFIWQIMA